MVAASLARALEGGAARDRSQPLGDGLRLPALYRRRSLDRLDLRRLLAVAARLHRDEQILWDHHSRRCPGRLGKLACVGAGEPSRYSTSARSETAPQRGQAIRNGNGSPGAVAHRFRAVHFWQSGIAHRACVQRDEPGEGSPSADRPMLGPGRVGRSAYPISTK